MKKLVSVAAVLALVAITISSCRTGEDCPAYGKVEVGQVGENC